MGPGDAEINLSRVSGWHHPIVVLERMPGKTRDQKRTQRKARSLQIPFEDVSNERNLCHPHRLLGLPVTGSFSSSPHWLPI